MKRIVAAILIVLMSLLAAGCATSDVNTKADTTKAKGDNAGSGSARIGQPVTIKGMDDGAQVQVTALKIVETKSTNQFMTVDKGKRLVAVQFKIVNTGKAPYNDAPSNGAVVVDSKGQQYQADIMFDSLAAGQMLPATVKLAPNNKALGFIAFQVPLKAKIAQVQFGMDSGFSDTAQWNVK